MKKMKYTRTWLVIALLVTIIGSLTGGTVAWFTDSTESTGNVIKSGTLDIGLNYTTEYKNENTTWTDVEADGAAPIFNYKYWEPGYTDLKYVQVVNKGDLAFKYQIKVVPSVTPVEGEVNLADKIDVYYAIVDLGKGETSTFTVPKSFADIKATWTNAGTLSDMTEVEETAVHGVMLDDQKSTTIAIALHMQEEAGNEYQNLTVGDGFAIQLYAAQYTHEEDAFNNLYDENAPFVNLPSADVEKVENFGTFTPANANRLETVDVGYTFTATEDNVDESPYKEWHADFTISFDKPVKADIVGLAGAYAAYNNGEWLGFDIKQDVIDAAMGRTESTNEALPANTAVRMLGTADINFSYEMICDIVKQFDCGTYAISEEANGITATVELRLYEPADDVDNTNNETETGKYITIATFYYTYEYKGE